jgi:hypothetical protein
MDKKEYGLWCLVLELNLCPDIHQLCEHGYELGCGQLALWNLGLATCKENETSSTFNQQ